MALTSNLLRDNESFSSGIADAVNYTAWIVDTFRPHIGSDLLEVGLGAGNYLDHFPSVQSYKGLDYDEDLIAHLKVKHPSRDYAVADLSLDSFIEIAGPETYDTVFCCNVLEHIEDDRAALDRLMATLKPGGKMLLYVPAFQQLYSDMDKLAGHHRRYTKKSLKRCWAHRNDKQVCLEYFNSIGGVGWWAQKFSKVENLDAPDVYKKIIFFDKYVLPLSRAINSFTRLFFGQSVLAVLEKSS